MRQKANRSVLRGTLLAAVGLLLLAAPAYAQSAGEPSTISELDAAFDVGNVHSDFVVVIDTSSSMTDGPDPLYPRVRQAYAGLVDAIPDGDWLSLITFDTVPTVSVDGPLTSANREAAKTLPDAIGQATDIGAALNAAVERLDRPGSAQIQTVIFVTDGRHEPPNDSAFAQVGSPAWAAAQSRANGLEQRRTILVRALGLTDKGNEGAELASKIFSKTEVVQLSGQQLSDYLTAEVGKARRRVLSKLIQDEVDDNGIDAKVTPTGKLADQVKATVELRSRLAHLGADVNLKRVVARDGRGKEIRSSIIDGSRTIHLAPEGTARFQILLKPSVEEAPLFSWPPPKREEVDVQLDFEQSAHITPTRLLEQELGVKTEVTVKKADVFTVGRTVGKTWARLFTELAVLLVGLILASWIWWRWIRRPGLAGELILVGAAADVFPPLHLRGKKMKVESSDLGQPGSTVLWLYTKRGKRNLVFVERLGIDGAIERKSSRKWVAVESGSALGLIEYRLDGDGGSRFRWRLAGEQT